MMILRRPLQLRHRLSLCHPRRRCRRRRRLLLLQPVLQSKSHLAV